MSVPHTPNNLATAHSIAAQYGLTGGLITYGGGNYDYLVDGRVIGTFDIARYAFYPLKVEPGTDIDRSSIVHGSDAPGDATIDLEVQPIQPTRQPSFVPREDLQGDPAVSAPQEVGGVIRTAGVEVLEFSNEPEGPFSQQGFGALGIEANPAFLLIGAAFVGWWVFGR